MAYWREREELSRADRLRRSYYELLRDDLDQFILQYALTDSYHNFARDNIPYPFVEKRELKPRARIPDVEYERQNVLLLIFVEDIIPNTEKKYVRFFDNNKTAKKNLIQSKALPVDGRFDRSQKFLESVHFYNFLKMLLPVDYALLLQREDSRQKRNKYKLTHFHVRIDWPVTDAAEDLARQLRYISKDIYERGDQYAEELQKKFFEHYGLPLMAGGRRTAAVVAFQYLKRLPCITTVYVGSSESRALIRISERGVSKSVLMKFGEEDAKRIAEAGGIDRQILNEHYAVAREEKDIICIFQATYSHTSHAQPPDDGKLRDLKSDYNWLSVSGQHVLPLPGNVAYPPIPINIIYT